MERGIGPSSKIDVVEGIACSTLNLGQDSSFVNEIESRDVFFYLSIAIMVFAIPT